MNKEKLFIFDTTLRDGKQAPGVKFSLDEEVEIARRLDELGVNAIEAGTPVTSEQEFKKVKAIADQITRPVICALARAGVDGDIDAAWNAIKGTKNPRLHLFYSSSDIHQEHQLHIGRDEAIEKAVAGIRRAVRHCEVQFSPMDATRTDPNYLYLYLTAAIDAGATIVNIPDTMGYAFPVEYGNLVSNILDERNVLNIKKARVSVHCHNDFGMATANTVTGVQFGARQVELTINGVGERAGNADHASVIMAICARSGYLQDGVDVSHINTEFFGPISRYFASVTNRPISPDMPMVGSSVFSHESGIHGDGVRKNPQTYETVDPKLVGWIGQRFVLGQTSGRGVFQKVVEDLFGYVLEGSVLQRAFGTFQVRVNEGEVTNAVLKEIVEGAFAIN